MQKWMRNRRVVGTLMLGVMAAALVAPAAQAGSRRTGSFAGYRVSSEPVRSQVSYRNHSSGAGPLIAGLIGGIVIGSIISNSSSHASVETGYSYYDPYCEESYGSLDSYRSHIRGCDHPYVCRVMQRDQYVQDVCWQNNNWHDYDCGDQGGYERGNYGGGGWNRGGGQWNDERCDIGNRDGRRRGNDRWNHGDRRYKNDRGWNRGEGRDDRNRDGDRRWNEDGGRDGRNQNDIWDEDEDGVPNSRDQYDRDPRRN